MTAHRGQVALYLVAVLVAITVLTLMNVGIYFSVTAKNRAMNAGDAAALAVAHYQGELLNRIGSMNLHHLVAAAEDDDEACEKVMLEQLRCCFLDPIEGLAEGSRVARENGADLDEAMTRTVRELATEVRQNYAVDTRRYPEPWMGAWEEYAMRLEVAASGGVWAGPDNLCFPDANTSHILLNPSFYQAVGGGVYCWFKFHYPELPGSWSNVHDWPPLREDDEAFYERPILVNGMVYPLHLTPVTGSAVQLLGTNLVCRLAKVTEGELKRSRLLNDETQQWMFYDLTVWRAWWEIAPDGPNHFPVVGAVRPEYNLRGCAAACRVCRTAPAVFSGDEDKAFAWTAAAKPFGTVEDEEGRLVSAAALNGFVLPAFEAVHLVPLDAVEGGAGEMSGGADPVWLRHVRRHVPRYLETGNLIAATSEDCWYCQQLQNWGKTSVRRQLARQIRHQGELCERPEGGGTMSAGGTAHGH